MLKDLLALDIETYTLGKTANDYTDQAFVKTGNIKDPEKLQAKIEEGRAKLRQQHALHWWTGKVISVAVVGCDNSEAWCEADHDEKSILVSLADRLRGGSTQIIGKSLKIFDRGFLIGRYMANNLSIPAVLKSGARCFDIDDYFGYGSMCSQRGKLDDYAHGLGLKNKPMSGKEVHALYSHILHKESQGEDTDELWRQLIDYNIHDATIVADAVRRYHA